jgi:cell wall-associated NlpC family hydrolase
MTTGSLAATSTGFALATSDGAPATPSGPVTAAGMVGGGVGVGGRDVATRPASDVSLAAALATSPRTFTALSITADHPAIKPDSPVVFTVRAVSGTGRTPVGGETVWITVVDGPRWTTTARLQTNGAGEAYISARLLSTTTLTAVFDGSGALRPSLADATTVTVTAPAPRSSNGGSSIAGTPSVVTEVPASGIGAKAVYIASLQNGKPYVYGAAGPYAFDCSGYAQYVYKQLGRMLPRTAQQQFRATTRIPKSGKQPGDLIFFGSPTNITHMGIYAGNGYMWAAPQSGRNVNLQPIYTSSYYVGRVR